MGRVAGRQRRGGREAARGGLRKGVAAGEKLETAAPLGSRTVRLSQSSREAPANCSVLFALGPLLSASASGSRSCPPVPRPAEVTPTALIIFCFALGLFSATNFQQSPWRRTGEGAGAAMEIPGPGRRVAPANFSGSPGLRDSGSHGPGRKALPRGVARGAPRPGLRAASALAKTRVTGPGDPGPKRLSLDPAAKARRRRLAGGKSGGAHSPLAGHTHTRGETESNLATGATLRPPAPGSPSPQTWSPGRRRRPLA